MGATALINGVNGLSISTDIQFGDTESPIHYASSNGLSNTPSSIRSHSPSQTSSTTVSSTLPARPEPQSVPIRPPSFTTPPTDKDRRWHCVYRYCHWNNISKKTQFKHLDFLMWLSISRISLQYLHTQYSCLDLHTLTIFFYNNLPHHHTQSIYLHNLILISLTTHSSIQFITYIIHPLPNQIPQQSSHILHLPAF